MNDREIHPAKDVLVNGCAAAIYETGDSAHLVYYQPPSLPLQELLVLFALAPDLPADADEHEQKNLNLCPLPIGRTDVSLEY
jgi:hypothetical protein